MARRFTQILFFALAIRPFMALFVGLRVKGLANLPARDPFILVANHSSHLDTFSLLSLFPLARLDRVRPVAAADYFEANRVVSFVTKTLFNILPIARRNITSATNPLRKMLEALDRGDTLVIFPEGTRGTGDRPASFRPGIAHLIEARPEIPVVPAWLVNTGRSLPKGELIPVPFFIEVRLGPARLVAKEAGGGRDRIVATLEQALRELSHSDVAHVAHE